MTHKVYLGLGSNLGDREAIINQAIDLIGKRVGKVVRQSSLIETEPWGFESENKFLNGVILCETSLTPRRLLKTTQSIERTLGKNHSHATERNSTVNCQLSTVNYQLSTVNYHDRPIDIDILLYDDLTVDEPDLKIPHPLMQEREFVMIPLTQIKPR